MINLLRNGNKNFRLTRNRDQIDRHIEVKNGIKKAVAEQPGNFGDTPHIFTLPGRKHLTPPAPSAPENWPDA